MALGMQFSRRPSKGLVWLPTFAELLIQQATALNSDLTRTYTRASNAYDPYNRVTASSGVARQRPLPFGRRSFVADLIEPAATNLFLRSQDLANAAWTKTDCTITTGAANAPDGTATLDLVTDGTAGTALITQGVTITAGRACAMAGVFKLGNNPVIRMSMENGSDAVRAWFNLSTGTVGTVSNIGTSTGAAGRIESLGGGLYLCQIGGVINAASTGISTYVLSVTADGSSTRVNNATRYQGWMMFVMGAASSTSMYVSSYIATTTATVTRAADALSVPYVLGQTGTILALCIPYGWTGDQDGNSNWCVFSADDTNLSRIQRANGSVCQFYRNDAGGQEFGNITHGLTNGALKHMGGTWDASAVKSFKDGAIEGTDATLTAPYNTNTVIKIGSNNVGGFQFSGWVALLAWPRALSASELLALYTALPVAA